MSKYSPIITDIQKAVEVIRQGRVVAFPTGTCYGLAADALQGHALQRVRNLKHRPAEKSLTVFMYPSLYDTHLELTAAEKEFIAKNTGKAVTLLVKPKPSLAHLAQDGRIGLRFIDHPIMTALAKAVNVPLTATSANVADKPSCFDVAGVEASFPGLLTDELLAWYEPEDMRGAKDTTYDLSLGCILDGGALPPTKPSTIIKIEEGKIVTVRAGKEKIAS
ncbi:MAG: L-threonylcarbamoyladenylate synthase [Candidatus Andersenbacteria bacterium]|nr:L-threonylcarbamoyladenylate synthase [Candidatus Andersenbacteria bacterium]